MELPETKSTKYTMYMYMMKALKQRQCKKHTLQGCGLLETTSQNGENTFENIKKSENYTFENIF